MAQVVDWVERPNPHKIDIWVYEKEFQAFSQLIVELRRKERKLFFGAASERHLQSVVHMNSKLEYVALMYGDPTDRMITILDKDGKAKTTYERTMKEV